MSSYGTDLHDRILQASHQDVRYMDIFHRLYPDASAGIGIGSGTGTGGSVGIGTGAGA